MNSTASAAWIAAGLFLGTILSLEIGYRLAGHRSKDRSLAHEGVGSVEAAVFALLGLLLGFSFAGGTSRLDARRQLIVDEANTIGTAYLRVDLLSTADQPEMRRLFREYLDSRLMVYQKLSDATALRQELDRASNIQRKIWSSTVTASHRASNQHAAVLLLPAINEMMDVTTSRTVALYTQLPALIFGLLIAVALLSGLLAGYAMAKRRSRSWIHMVVYAMAVSVTIYAVSDLDHPRSGLIRVDAADAALVELRNSIQ